MKGKRFTEELIIRVLQEAESVLTAADVPIVYKQHPQNDSGKHQRQRSAIESCGLVAFLFLLWRGGPWHSVQPDQTQASSNRACRRQIVAMRTVEAMREDRLATSGH